MQRETQQLRVLKCFISIIILGLLPGLTSPQAMYGAGAQTLNPLDMETGDLSSQRSGMSDFVDGNLLNLDTNHCKPDTQYVWCLPQDYNLEKHPFSFFSLVNKSLPWDYDFRFVIEEINNINDKAQIISISMYFAVSWFEPRLKINQTAVEWTEARTGPRNEVNESPEILKYIWYPELEIYGLDTFGRQRVLKEMSGVRVNRNKTITYELGVRIAISCRMNFDDYPLDEHTCQFQVGSYYDTNETVTCQSYFLYEEERQRSLQHYIQIANLPALYKKVSLPSGTYAACGFEIHLQRKQTQFLIQVYLPTFMFVIVSWVSFLIKPEVVPGRMALLVTLFLVLINIFNSVREDAPISSSLNAIDLYLVMCIILVFGALLEYAAILLLLKKKRVPLRKLEQNQNGHKIENITMGMAGDNMENNSLPNGDFEKSVDIEINLYQCQEGDDLTDENNKTKQGSASHRSRKRRKSRPGGYSPIYQTRQSKNEEDYGLSKHKQDLVDNIDAWAMWISPPLFVLWNFAYWLFYQL